MPESVDDPVLGRLEWEAELDWWVGAIDLFPGLPIDLFVVHDCQGGSPVKEIALARRGFLGVRKREPEYRRWTASQLLDKRWNQDEPMSADDIADLLRVASLEFSPDGRARIFWNDEDMLFGGHNVVTDLSAEGKCVEAGME
jgi:hypothetical protein